MHSWSVSELRQDGCFCFFVCLFFAANALPCTRVVPSEQETFQSFWWLSFLQFVHTQGPVTLRARCILCAFLRLCCMSVRLCGGWSLYAHQTPHHRTYPPPGAQSRPFARILSQNHCQGGREDEIEKSCYWPMVTQTLFLYTHTHSRCLRHHVMTNKIFICNALFVSNMEDAVDLLFPLGFPGFHLYGQPCARWKIWSFKKAYQLKCAEWTLAVVVITH